MDAGAVGLSVTYARKFHHSASGVGVLTVDAKADGTVQFTDFVLWIVRMYAAVEMSLNSVERVGECELSLLPLYIANRQYSRCGS
jgi:hypothetical protein